MSFSSVALEVQKNATKDHVGYHHNLCVDGQNKRNKWNNAARMHSCFSGATKPSSVLSLCIHGSASPAYIESQDWLTKKSDTLTKWTKLGFTTILYRLGGILRRVLGSGMGSPTRTNCRWNATGRMEVARNQVTQACFWLLINVSLFSKMWKDLTCSYNLTFNSVL